MALYSKIILEEASYYLLSRDRARTTLRISLSRYMKLLPLFCSESLHGTISSMRYSNEFFLKSSEHFSNLFKKYMNKNQKFGLSLDCVGATRNWLVNLFSLIYVAIAIGKYFLIGIIF